VVIEGNAVVGEIVRAVGEYVTGDVVAGIVRADVEYVAGAPSVLVPYARAPP